MKDWEAAKRLVEWGIKEGLISRPKPNLELKKNEKRQTDQEGSTNARRNEKDAQGKG